MFCMESNEVMGAASQRVCLCEKALQLVPRKWALNPGLRLLFFSCLGSDKPPRSWHKARGNRPHRVRMAIMISECVAPRPGLLCLLLPHQAALTGSHQF